jgi:hypothetical protein
LMSGKVPREPRVEFKHFKVFWLTFLLKFVEN